MFINLTQNISLSNTNGNVEMVLKLTNQLFQTQRSRRVQCEVLINWSHTLDYKNHLKQNI